LFEKVFINKQYFILLFFFKNIYCEKYFTTKKINLFNRKIHLVQTENCCHNSIQNHLDQVPLKNVSPKPFLLFNINFQSSSGTCHMYVCTLSATFVALSESQNLIPVPRNNSFENELLHKPCGHRVRLQSRRSRVRIPLGFLVRYIFQCSCQNLISIAIVLN
jgi:hypothetical protein